MNPNGNAANLLPSEAGNVRAARHGVFSEGRRLLEPVAQEIAEDILAAPHVVDMDELGAIEIARLESLIRAIDCDLAEHGLTNRRGDARSLLDLRLRASRRLAEWLDRYGLTPHGRADWAGKLAGGGLGAEIRRRLEALEEAQPDEH